jgi:hypothetical protein
LSECLHRVLVVGGDEHQMRAAPDALRRLDARQARHVHVEKTDIGVMGFELPHGLAAIADLRDHLQLGPRPFQLAREGFAQQRFVIRDQGSRARAHQAAGCAGNSSSAQAPRGLSALRRT